MWVASEDINPRTYYLPQKPCDMSGRLIPSHRISSHLIECGLSAEALSRHRQFDSIADTSDSLEVVILRSGDHEKSKLKSSGTRPAHIHAWKHRRCALGRRREQKIRRGHGLARRLGGRRNSREVVGSAEAS